ncbi:MAG: response regulator [Pseudolabrys sp.]|nr:response regulator [Pseudolabrys sp.]MBV9954365.1 response regulator [Pseudolabrys sp.]
MARQYTREMIQGLSILVVDSNSYMRRVTRMMLTNLGAKTIYEAPDSLAALEVARTFDPDVMVLNWNMPVLSGLELLRIIRSPALFPKPELPVIMLSDCTRRSDVAKALRSGVHEFLVRPTSSAMLENRLLSIAANPRPMVQVGPFYVPQPRRMRASEGEAAAC